MKEILLTHGKIALVDDADFDFLNQWVWFAHYNKNGNNWYAARKSPRPEHKEILMYKVLLDPSKNIHVHFKNKNSLDLQRNNVQLMTLSADRHNKLHRTHKTSKYKGVSWNNQKKNWRAYIRTTYLGSYKSELEAAYVYDKAAKEVFGEFARTNFKES